MLSVNNWRITRQRDAPSAVRIAISFSREARAGQQQIRDVGTADQQHKNHGAEQQPSSLFVSPTSVVKRNYSIETTVVRIGILLSQPRSDRLHFSPRLLLTYARF